MPILEIKKPNTSEEFWTCWLISCSGKYCLSCFQSENKVKAWADLFLDVYKKTSLSANKKIQFDSKYMEDILREMPQDEEDGEPL